MRSGSQPNVRRGQSWIDLNDPISAAVHRLTEDQIHAHISPRLWQCSDRRERQPPGPRIKRRFKSQTAAEIRELSIVGQPLFARGQRMVACRAAEHRHTRRQTGHVLFHAEVGSRWVVSK